MNRLIAAIALAAFITILAPALITVLTDLAQCGQVLTNPYGV